MEFAGLKAQQELIKSEVDARLSKVFTHGLFIMGPEVFELEQELSRYCGGTQVVTCGSGTEALLLSLMAWGIKAGDAVYIPSFTFAATAEAVVLCGATPVFVDVLSSTYNIDPASLAEAIESTEDLRPSAVIAVDLFGLPADYPEIFRVAESVGARVLADAAQSFGARQGEQRVGRLGEATATSFFPAKPLGCYGDGGAIFTENESVAGILRSLRVHGQGSHKYENVRVGMNARLDTIQAAVLLEKLKVFESEREARSRVASLYDEHLPEEVGRPHTPSGMTSAWAQYTIRVAERDAVFARLVQAEVPAAIYYPVPLHQQPAYMAFPRAPHGLPVSEQLSGEVLSIPVHPYLAESEIDQVLKVVGQIYG